MNGVSGRIINHAIKIQLNKYGRNARLSHGVRMFDLKKNTRIAKETEKYLPERCYALVDSSGKIYKYCMMTHKEARIKSKQTSMLGFRWTQCTPKNIKEIKTK